MESSAVEPREPVASGGLLLDGENPESLHLDDPEHWVAVYSELVETTNRMLDSARERLARESEAEQADLRLVEMEITALLARAEFFAARRRWWTKRGRYLRAQSNGANSH